MGYLEAIWKSIVLGTVQGLTEFLPVSSSGHLSLFQRILGYDAGGGMMFVNIMLHLGTLVAVVIVFWRDILALFKKPFKTLLMLIVATVAAGLVGVLAGDKIDELFAGAQGLLYLAICFACTAVMLIVCELVARRGMVKTRPLGWKNAVPMGILQAVALFPGISRSGSTIVAGTVSGAKREDVAKFSFLMSIPIILGSIVFEVKDLIFPAEGSAPLAMGGPEIVGMLLGVVSAAVFGLLSIKVMLKIIGRANYKWFAFYLVLLSMTCFWLNALGVLA